MPPPPLSTIEVAFADLPDPRTGPATRHPLLTIVTIAVCAVLAGADTWVDVAEFGRSKEAWFRSFLALPAGIPSHDTFGRVFAALDPTAFETCFVGWVRRLVRQAPATIAIDGKTLRRSGDAAAGLGPLHLVSAWATDQQVVLGQVATDAKSNEITAIPLLLGALDLDGTVITIDAMGCQRAIARQIVAGGGDSVLALKENQPELHALVAHHFALVAAGMADPPVTHRTITKNHGRLEVRTCQVTDDPAVRAWLDPAHHWPRLRSLVAITGERRIGDQTTSETRYYLASLPPDAVRIAAAIRGHWGIENQLHWVLDLAFREDDSRVRVGHAAENLAVLRKLAHAVLTRDRSVHAGIHAKRLKAGWDTAYLHRLLTT